MIDDNLLVAPCNEHFKLIQPVSITFKPLRDITAYELAQLLPLFFTHSIMPGNLPKEPELLRHLEIHDPNKAEK